ncbi:hypothetical protein EAT43_23320 [Vibrio parahaemolyticus]|nr:hypothetical protein [Vibrio parahaemolyticus]
MAWKPNFPKIEQNQNMNKPIVSCLWQATLRLKTQVITLLASGDHLIQFGYGIKGESHACR